MCHEGRHCHGPAVSEPLTCYTLLGTEDRAKGEGPGRGDRGGANTWRDKMISGKILVLRCLKLNKTWRDNLVSSITKSSFLYFHWPRLERDRSLCWESHCEGGGLVRERVRFLERRGGGSWLARAHSGTDRWRMLPLHNNISWPSYK